MPHSRLPVLPSCLTLPQLPPVPPPDPLLVMQLVGERGSLPHACRGGALCPADDPDPRPHPTSHPLLLPSAAVGRAVLPHASSGAAVLAPAGQPPPGAPRRAIPRAARAETQHRPCPGLWYPGLWGVCAGGLCLRAVRVRGCRPAGHDDGAWTSGVRVQAGGACGEVMRGSCLACPPACTRRYAKLLDSRKKKGGEEERKEGHLGPAPPVAANSQRAPECMRHLRSRDL